MLGSGEGALAGQPERASFGCPGSGFISRDLFVCLNESFVLECSKRCVDGIRVTFFMKITEIGCR